MSRCEFLSSLADDAVMEDYANSKYKMMCETSALVELRLINKQILLGIMAVEEKRLCDVHQHSNPTFIDATLKNIDKIHSVVTAKSQTTTDLNIQPAASSLNLDQNCIQLFSMPTCSTVQV